MYIYTYICIYTYLCMYVYISVYVALHRDGFMHNTVRINRFMHYNNRFLSLSNYSEKKKRKKMKVRKNVFILNMSYVYKW